VEKREVVIKTNVTNRVVYGVSSSCCWRISQLFFIQKATFSATNRKPFKKKEKKEMKKKKKM